MRVACGWLAPPKQLACRWLEGGFERLSPWLSARALRRSAVSKTRSFLKGFRVFATNPGGCLTRHCAASSRRV